MGDAELKTCKRCKLNRATISMRQDMVCESCYANFVSYKVIKRMGIVLKELRYLPNKPRTLKPKYILGLSFGPSSAALFHMLDENASRLEGKNPHLLFELTAVHIDTDLSSSPSSEAEGNAASSPSSSRTSSMVNKYRSRFPRFNIESVPLATALDLDTIDWSTLPPTTTTETPAPQPQDDARTRLRRLLLNLPSNSSRVDVLRLLVRHLLLHVAVEKGYDALLLGCSTTALAEVTLAETAKGRGNSVPVLISDGPYPMTRFAKDGHEATRGGDQRVPEPSDTPETAKAPTVPSATTSSSTFPVYFPLRDVLRREIVQYNDTSEVSMAEMVRDDLGDGGSGNDKGASVVSHRDLSIEDVMARYFEEVETGYPSVVTNVVRTSGRLTRPDGDACGLCGMALDEQGDARWKGEIGEDELGEDTLSVPHQGDGSKGRLCYGCQRTVRR